MAETNENKTFDFLTALKYLQEGKKVRNVGSLLDYYYVSGGLIRCKTGATCSLPVNSFLMSWELYNG